MLSLNPVYRNVPHDPTYQLVHLVISPDHDVPPGNDTNYSIVKGGHVRENKLKKAFQTCFPLREDSRVLYKKRDISAD